MNATMRNPSSTLYLLCVTAALGILADCSSGGNSQLYPSRAVQQNPAWSGLNSPSMLRIPVPITPSGLATARPDHSRSWMEPNARQQDLLYVSDQHTYDVYV